MAALANMPAGERVAEFPDRGMKPQTYDYDAMAKLEMPYRFTFLMLMRLASFDTQFLSRCWSVEYKSDS